MSVYHPSFNFLNKNSYDDFNLIVSHFDGDQGESDTWLGMDPIYSDSADGTRRIDYGAKFNSVATPKITVIKADGTDFTVQEVRQFLKWTTGSRKNSYLELCEWSEIKSKWEAKFRLLGRVTKAYQQKLDARTIGLIIEFTTVSPFAYSPVQTIEVDIYGHEVNINLPHESDDLDTPICLNVTFTNGSKDNILILSSDAMTKATEISGLLDNETITLDTNGFIVSDAGRTLGSSNFNYVFPKIGYSSDMEKVDTLKVTGNGHIVFQYIYFIKIGDCTIDVDVSASGIMCGGSASGGNNSGGVVAIEELPWDKIIDKPTTIKGYGITDAYTRSETNNLIQKLKIEIDEKELMSMLEEVLEINVQWPINNYAILGAGVLGEIILGKGV